jgi:hypothetical protein
MDGFSISCGYCGLDSLFQATPSKNQDPLEWSKAWKLVQAQSFMVTCASCGGAFSVTDDGVDPDLGGSVAQINMSKPRIDSLSVASGGRLGGEAIFLYGSALEVGDLVVKFGGKVVTRIHLRESDRVRITVPPARYTLNVAQSLTPGTDFIVGESLLGKDSGARGVVASVSPFVVDNPTRAFLPNEEVTGDASRAKLQLQSIPYSGAVDVTVENEHGQRLQNGALEGGYTYA